MNTITMTAIQKKRLLKLLRMPYAPAEIAEIAGVPECLILDACAAGCPHQIDDTGAWIIGTDFLKWAGITGNPNSSDRKMINRENWREVMAFLQYNEQLLQLDAKTVKRKRTHLRHLLEWAGPTPLEQATEIKPSFPVYMLNARNDHHGTKLSAETMNRGCEEVRRFFTWAIGRDPAKYARVTGIWIKSIHPNRAHGRQSELKIHQFYTLEEMQKIASLPVDNLTERRDRAAACFLFLSGMRADAFVTMPINAVDMAKNQIKQLPALGMRTKNKKAAITHLLQIPELLEVVQEWDQFVKTTLPVNALWYATLSTSQHLTGRTYAGTERRAFITKGLIRLCNRANIPYRSPHKLRHGHAVYGIKHAKTIEQLKAVSQNLMHHSITITDGVYGNLAAEDVAATIASLGSTPTPPAGPVDTSAFMEALAKLAQNPELIKKVMEL